MNNLLIKARERSLPSFIQTKSFPTTIPPYQPSTFEEENDHTMVKIQKIFT